MGAIADAILPQLKIEEGFRPRRYKDSRGYETIGYGLNLDAPMPERLAFVILQWQADQAEHELQQFDWYTGCDPIRQRVLVDMNFNMGLDKLLTFHKFLAAVAEKDWGTAHIEMNESLWATEVGAREQNLSRIMLTGEP